MTSRRKKKLPPGVVEKNGRHYVRVRYKGDDGKRHASWRECAKNPTDAKEVRAALKLELSSHGPESLRHAQMTWLQLSQHFRDEYLQPAQIVDGRVVFGYRSIIPVEVSLQALDNFFGGKSIRKITRGDLRAFKRYRLTTPVVIEKWQHDEEGKRTEKIKVARQRSISSVNKELRTARHLLNIALDEEWLLKNPFKRNDHLISAADERRCMRVLTLDEERRLLDCCIGKRRHLRPRIICAIDSGMRWGEMNHIRVGDVDFDSRIIQITATHTKTLTTRRVKMTQRVIDELRPLCEGKQPDRQVFQFASVKTAWTGLRDLAGLRDVRWHDLRHTNATRLEKSRRVSAGQLQRHLGHSDPRSTNIYVNQDEEAVDEIAVVLEEATARMETRSN